LLISGNSSKSHIYFLKIFYLTEIHKHNIVPFSVFYVILDTIAVARRAGALSFGEGWERVRYTLMKILHLNDIKFISSKYNYPQ